MRNGLVFLTSAAVLCSGCATVDLNSMAGTERTEAVASAPETNVIERAVARLKAVFASRGFGEKSSQKKMQAATNILLNGLSASQSSDPDYMDVPRLVAEVREDMLIATQHVDQTTRAAEIYLEVVPDDRELDAELDNLQTALLSSERAARSFAAALDAYLTGSSDSNSDLLNFNASVDALRSVTDAFGDRVRHKRDHDLGLETVG